MESSFYSFKKDDGEYVIYDYINDAIIRDNMTRREVIGSLVGVLSGKNDPMLTYEQAERVIEIGRVEQALDNSQKLFDEAYERINQIVGRPTSPALAIVHKYRERKIKDEIEALEEENMFLRSQMREIIENYVATEKEKEEKFLALSKLGEEHA
jgi:hypothetical protein